jgi:membrane dipeptidase
MVPMPDMTDAERLHADAVVLDATCPIEHWTDHNAAWREGGATCCAVTVASTESARETLRTIAWMYALLRERPSELRLATSVEDILEAKRRGELAVVLHFQGTEPIEYDVDLLEVFWRLGVRVIQLAYNRRNPLCDGCEEPVDAGLSTLGRRAIAEMNRLGIVVDVTHTGQRSALEAIELSSAACVASHSNASAVHANPRNISDELIRAIAGSGGVVGINGFPSFVADSPRPTLDQFIDHMAHVGDLVGLEHVGLGIDYYDGTRGDYDAFIASGAWSPATYGPPPWHYPSGIESASGLVRLTERLLQRGFGEDDVRGILGGNWLRVYGDVWGSRSG